MLVITQLIFNIKNQEYWASAPAYLVRDNDGAYGHVFTRRVMAMGIRDRPISPGHRGKMVMWSV